MVSNWYVTPMSLVADPSPFFKNHAITLSLTMADPEGVRLNTIPAPVFKYHMKQNNLVSVRLQGETKSLHFHGIFKKNELHSAKFKIFY